jgi:uncharacterized protein
MSFTLTPFLLPWYLRNAHIQTILPSLFRKVNDINYQRERLELPDGDFIDLDWSRVASKKLCVVLHGLESNAQRAYIKGIVRALNDHNTDVVVLNFRSCSGTLNRHLGAYHIGMTDDLWFLVQQLSLKHYQSIDFAGVSLGGNVLLKFLGEYADKLPTNCSKAFALSVPCHLVSSTKKIEKSSNWLYQRKFLRSLKVKIRQKRSLFTKNLNFNQVINASTLSQFDEYFTAPVHGFLDSTDFYEKSSSLQFIPKIKIETLLINAEDDPFLTPLCMPKKESQENDKFIFLSVKQGGHVGFCQKINQRTYWQEQQMIRFFNDQDEQVR